MLRSLHIENVAVIRCADLELSQGFTALTGETGAGKSMIIDSINLLLGNRVSKEIIRSGEDSATVGAVFEEIPSHVCEMIAEMGFSVPDGSLMLQRTLYRDGRSQARLDGRVITQTVQRELARLLISIHGQSDNQKLLQKSSHRQLVDDYARPTEEAAAYRESYNELQECRKRLAALTRDDAERMRLCEMLSYQIADIDSVKPKRGEEEKLARERDRLLCAEQINKQAGLAYRALRGGEKANAYDLIRRAQAAIRSLGGVLEGIDALSERLEATVAEIDDVAESVLSFSEEDMGDPTARIDKLESRLDAISKLKRKYGNSIDEVLAFRERAAAQLEELDSSDELRAELESKVKLLDDEARRRAALLTQKRCAAGEQITRAVTQSLAFLDMPKVRFSVSVAPTELSESGADDVEFLIATNPGEPLLPMIKIASGGELSRIMLSLRSVLNDHDGASTVIFDEVDAGVSGKTSRKIGIKLKETSNTAQVLCVTHSAQIASLAHNHLRILKKERDGRAETEICLLDEDARVEEIARILGGIEVTAAQRDAAREMINEYDG